MEGDQQIPPSDHLHACVNFRGEDIKDLHVHEVGQYDTDVTAVVGIICRNSDGGSSVAGYGEWWESCRLLL